MEFGLLLSLVDFFLIFRGQIVVLVLLNTMYVMGCTVLQHIDLVEHVLLGHVSSKYAKSLSRLYIRR